MLMVNKNIFVIGAGASGEANLPTGNELKNKIVDLLDIGFNFSTQIRGDRLIVDALRELDHDINLYLDEARHIRDALPQAISIDNFIDSQRGNEELAICGKLAIVRSILEAEEQSSMFYKAFIPGEPNNNFDFKAIEDTWYNSFFQILTENCVKGDLEERFKSVVLIVFNYDRCIEFFLYEALQNYYRIDGKEAAELISNLTIYHPYGSVGSLPWQQADEIIGFGVKPVGLLLKELAVKIKTFTEGTDPSSSEIIAIRQHMANAQKLVFLGFAFHKLNMELISPDVEVTNKSPQVYATAYGVSKSDQNIIKNQIKGMYRRKILATLPEMNIQMSGIDCNSFFKEYWRSLSF